jgi:hypothetical protein
MTTEEMIALVQNPKPKDAITEEDMGHLRKYLFLMRKRGKEYVWGRIEETSDDIPWCASTTRALFDKIWEEYDH